MFTESKRTLLESAARWHVRLNAPDCTDGERARFQSWRQQDPSHNEAYLAAEQISGAVTMLGATDPRLRAMTERAFAMGAADTAPGRSLHGTRRLAITALAAGLADVVVGVAVMSRIPSTVPETDYSAQNGLPRTIALQDGSVVHLDGGSSIKVRLSADQRQVKLLHGRAFFEVAHDAAHPFSVTAHGERITDLGTRFQVESDEQYLLVTLAEGSVGVSDDAPGETNRQEVLTPGEQLQIAWADHKQSKQMVDIESATSWSRGRLVFRATPLAAAVEQVNRYATKKLRIGDARLEQLPVSGNFITGNSDLTVSALVAVMPLRAVDAGQEIVLFPR
jgi:transmembrane sensor